MLVVVIFNHNLDIGALKDNLHLMHSVFFSVFIYSLRGYCILNCSLWLEQVQRFVSVKSGDRSSFLLFQLKV